jgi:hypothetical protein
MFNFTVSDLESIIRMQKGQQIVYENAEMDTLRTSLYNGKRITEDDPFGIKSIDNIIWGEKLMIVTVKDE